MTDEFLADFLSLALAPAITLAMAYAAVRIIEWRAARRHKSLLGGRS